MEIVREAHIARGFFEEAAGRMAIAQKASSLAVYEGKMKIFSTWCSERDTNSCKATEQLVVDFLCSYIRESCHLQTIEDGLDLGHSAHLSSLLANFARDKVRHKPSLPPWDLAAVLLMLTKKPFEPIQDASLKYVTL